MPSPDEPAAQTAVLTAANTVDGFFSLLAQRGHVPLLERVSGTLEVDLDGTNRYWITVRRGDVSVTRTPSPTDCVLGCDERTFADIIAGRQNAVAAAIRGAVTISGDLALCLSIQRVAMEGDGR